MTSKEKSPYLNKKDSINLQPHPFSKKGKSEIKENIKALIIGSGSLTNIEACLQKSDIAWKAANTKAEILQELNGQNVDVALFCTESSAVKISQVLNFLGRQPKYIPIILLSSEAKAKYVPLLNQGVFQIVSGQQIEFLPQFFLAAYNQALFEQQKKRQLELVQLQNNLIHDLEKNKALANSIQVFLSGVQQQLELPCTSFLFNSQEDSKEAYKAISVANCSNNTDQNLLSGQLISSLDHKQIKELQYGIPISLEASQLTELTEDKFGGLRGIKQLLLFPVNLDRRLLGLFAIALHKEDSIIWENETFSFFNTATLNLRNFFRAQSAKQSVLGYEEKLRQLFLLGSGLVVVANKEGIVTFASENHFSILGFRASKIVGRHLIELVHPDDIPLVRESFNQIKSNQRKTIPSIRVSSRKGPHRWMKVTLTNQLLNPSVKGVIINSTDITEIIEKERELELSELRFKLAANASADITFDWDLLEDKIYRDGSFGHSHKNAWRFKDFSSPESWEQHVHPADKDKIYALLKKALNDPKKTFCEAEYRMIDNHNHVIYVHDKGFILRDEDGKPIRLVGATTETTRQKVNELHSELIKSLQSFFSDEKNLTTSTRLLLKKFCELGDFSAAEFWIANPKKTSAQLLSTIAITDSGKKFLNQSTTSKFKTGHGFPGAAIEQDNILSEDLLAPEQQFNRQQMARNCGLKSAHCLPLYHLGDHIGSILLFSTHTASNNQFFIQVLDQFRSILSPELKRKIATEEIKTVFEASPVLIFRLNLEGKVLQCNRKAENLFGSNFTNCNFSDIIYPQDRHLWEKRIENKSKQIVSIELRIRGKFNQLIWLRMNVAVNAEEEILSIFAIDLTSEIELRNLLKEAQGLAKLSPFIYSLPNQRFHFPESLGKVLKLNADKNLRLDKFCSIIQDKLLANKLRKALSSPGIKTISVSEEIPITTNGKLRWIKFKAQHDPKVFTEEQLLGSIQDITELKEIQQELTRTNLRLNLAVNSRKMGIWDWDIQSDVLLWDDNMLEIFGVGREKFTEDFKVWQDAVHPDDVLPATQEVEKAIKGEKEFNTEFRI
ncbi:MAG: PAS domain-containing protein, partial [Luteibaculum sp.]